MRVAICYSGLVRNFWDCIDSHKKLILDILKPDVFIHTWSKIGSNQSPHWYNHSYNLNQHIHEIGLQQELDVDQIENLYNPTKIIIENPDIKHFYDKFYCDTNPNFFNNVMMHYGIDCANRLKKQYEQTHNFKYDIVIRCRFDLYFESIVFDDIINHNTIYLAPNENMDNPFTESMKALLNKDGNKYMPNDQFAYGSSEAMDYYSSVYDVYEKDYDFYHKHPESILTQHLWTKNTSQFNNIQTNSSIKMRIQSRYWKYNVNI
jgi:hypothetical protein